MSQHITTEEARQQSLSGFDVFKYTHLLYHDDLNRDHGVVKLNVEAFKIFSDTITVSHRHAIKTEQLAAQQWTSHGGFDSGLSVPWPNAMLLSLEHANYENLKIASAFELHLKARLLARDYILHEINAKIPNCKILADEQRDRPIKKHELITLQPYRFDGVQNYLPGLKEASVKFSLLTEKSHYRAALGLTDLQLDIIDDYRQLRNQIHFPGDFIEVPNIQAFPKPIIEFLIDFINSELVDWSNILIANHTMNRQLLVPFA